MWLLKKIREWWLARRAEKWRCKMVEQYGVAGQFFFKDMPKQSQDFFDENFKILDSKVSDDGQYVESDAFQNPNCSCEKVFKTENGQWFCVLCGHQIDESLLVPGGPQHLFFNCGGDVISSNGKKL